MHLCPYRRSRGDLFEAVPILLAILPRWLKSRNALTRSSLTSNTLGLFFLNSSLSGCALLLKIRINRWYTLQRQIKDRISVLFVGGSGSYRLLVLALLTYNFSGLMTFPMYSTVVVTNEHFLTLRVTPAVARKENFLYMWDIVLDRGWINDSIVWVDQACFLLRILWELGTGLSEMLLVYW